jgi:hypothetical protein
LAQKQAKKKKKRTLKEEARARPIKEGDFFLGKSTPKVPQLVIELQNYPSTAKPDIEHPSTYKTVHFRSFGGFDSDFI